MAWNLEWQWHVQASAEQQQRLSQLSEEVLSILASHELLALPPLARIFLADPARIFEIGFVYTDDEEIRPLNLEYRSKNYATDVLSFPQLSPEELELTTAEAFPPLIPLGDVVISIDTALRQAEEFECTEYEELQRLVVHGILHLLGFDHEEVSEEEAERMRALERRIIERSSNG